jgi:DNA replication protein DnaC
MRQTKIPSEPLRDLARSLGFYALAEDWGTYREQSWLEDLLRKEEVERKRRSLERRIRTSRVGLFKSIADFDFSWPKNIDREQLEDLLTLQFLDEVSNVIIIGPNGVGKTMIAMNLVYQALQRGATASFVTASEMLSDLAVQETPAALQRRLRKYTRPSLLAIDELGYLSYDHRHADLFFEVVSRRHATKPILVTTNKPFAEWGEVFPNASCVVTLVDRLTHHPEIVVIEGDSYRRKEAEATAAEKARRRAKRRKAAKATS